MSAQKLYNVQVLRGFAALIVCIHHSRFLVNITDRDIILDRFRGYIGVPIFFIISGFIMFFTTKTVSTDKMKNAREFILKRLIRVVPLLYFATFAIILINHHHFIDYFTTDLHKLIKTIFFIPLFTDLDGPAYGFSFLYVSWTLNYEMLFYSIFAISLLFSKLRYYFIYSLFLFMVVIIPVLSKGFFSVSPTIHYNFNYKYLNFLTNPILLLFILGITIGLILDRIKPDSKVLFYLTPVSFGIFILYFFRVIPDFKGSDLLICGHFVFSILYFDVTKFKIKPPRFLEYAGDISYSIYLIHPIVFMWLPHLFEKIGLNYIVSSWFFLMIGLATVIGVSILTNIFIEKKFSTLLKRKLLE